MMMVADDDDRIPVGESIYCVSQHDTISSRSHHEIPKHAESIALASPDGPGCSEHSSFGAPKSILTGQYSTVSPGC